MKNPQVSVLMAAYNSLRFLDEAVESIRAQTLQDWELIAIDDCSTDGTFRRLQEWSKKDARIRVFKTPENSGVGGARDFGVPHVRGQYVAIMDSDDIAWPERLEKQVAYLAAHPNVIGAGTQIMQITEDGGDIEEKFFPTDPATLYDLLYTAAPIQIPTLMVNMALVPDGFRWFERVRYAEDTLFFFNILQYGALANLPDCLQSYRYYAQSVTCTRPKEMFFQTWKARGIGRREYGYKARFRSRFVSGLQLLVVSCLPNAWVYVFYRRIRRIMLFISGHDERTGQA